MKKSCVFFNSVSAVCHHQIVFRLTGETEGKDFVWFFKLMSKRKKRKQSVLCYASVLLRIQTKWCMRVMVSVCVWMCERGLQEHWNTANSDSDILPAFHYSFNVSIATDMKNYETSGEGPYFSSSLLTLPVFPCCKKKKRLVLWGYLHRVPLQQYSELVATC